MGDSQIIKIKTIGEIGQNANGSLSIAKRLIDTAWLAGFDYVKFQKRDVNICVPEHKKNEPKTLWDGTETTYFHYKKLMEFNEDDYDKIDQYCKGKIKWFASAWDIPSASFLARFCDMVKIPSALITEIDFLKHCRANFMTVIMSTGMSTEEEIEKAVEAGQPDVIMHCNSSYPAAQDELNLRYIRWLMIKYVNAEIGYSGHEVNLQPTISAVAMGAKWIERHITLDRHMWGSDQLASVEPVGMYKLIKGIRDLEKSLGDMKERIVYDSELSKRKDLRKDFITL